MLISQRKSYIGLGLLLAALSIGTAVATLRYHFIPKRFGVVVPGAVFRSGQLSRHLIEDVIDRHRIGAIIDLNGAEPLNADQSVERALAKARGIQHDCFPLPGDGIGDPKVYARAIEAIVSAQRSRRPVLVHCMAGSRRTGACMAFYQLLVLAEPPEKVYRDLLHYSSNPRIEEELLTFINCHANDVAEQLVLSGVLPQVPAIATIRKP